MVDILTLNYNDAVTTADFVKSVEKYTCVDKILIVDNHSTDDSLNELKKIKSDKVLLIKSGINGGYGAGNNLGIRYLHEKCESKYILLANPDVIVDEKTINEMLLFLKNHSDYAIVAPLMTNPKGVVQYNTAFKLPRLWQFLMSFEILSSRTFKPFYYKRLENLPKPFCDVDALAGSLFMMNTEKMVRYGMFDENVFLYCEELILGAKFRNAKQKVALLTSEKYVHNHSVSISKSYKNIFAKNVLLNKSKIHYAKKYYKMNAPVLWVVRFLIAINLMESCIIDFLKK